MEKISIIIPVYFNRESILPLYEDIKKKVIDKISGRYDYEIVMVDDGSTDGSYNEIKKLHEIDNKIKPIRLSRNFGEHSAILAGLSVCTGDCAAMKAADLQEPSEMILDMLKKREDTKCKVVLALRQERDESFSRKFFGDTYSILMKKFVLNNMPKGGFDCFLIDRQVINLLTMMEEKNTSLMGQILWSGFKTEKVYYKRLKRDSGESKWTLSKKLKLVFDSVYSFSELPIKIITTIGLVMIMLSIIWLIYLLIANLTGNISVEGFTSTIAVMLLGFGSIIASLGVIGGYVWRIYDAVRKRPPFIIDKNYEDEKNSSRN